MKSTDTDLTFVSDPVILVSEQVNYCGTSDSNRPHRRVSESNDARGDSHDKKEFRDTQSLTDPPDFDSVREYFIKCLRLHGASPRGVDYNSSLAQETRFDQLLKVIDNPAPRFSVLDYGCGYGALAEYLAKKGLAAEYFGYDILEHMISAAQKVHDGVRNRHFLGRTDALPIVDYVVAGGTFNYCGHVAHDAWTRLIFDSLDRFDAVSRKGFASTFLTKYSDSERMRADLYYADPLLLFDYCKRHYSKNVALLHDYRLYDFTIIVRKDD